MHSKIVLIAIICAAFSILPAAAAASETIRVLVAENQKSVVLQSAEGLTADGWKAGRTEKKVIVGPEYLGTRPLRVAARGESLQMNGRRYRGAIEVRKKNGTLLVVNDLSLEEYLRGVIGAEIPADWEFEALKAQAVASRTYALYQKRNAGKKPYHIRADVNHQVYSGIAGERGRAVQAVQETQGLIVAYNGEVVPAFYHASCGGHTENAAELWGLDAPYLQGVACDCQDISRYGVWEKRFSLAAVSLALGRLGYRMRDISGLAINDMTPAGRVRTLAVRHAGGTTDVPAETLRSAVGYGAIPSVFFEPGSVRNGEVVFSGRGLGHGVGLCQWGAKEMAQRGYDFTAILLHYYPGTEIVPMETL